jgi:hypothetical protein
VWASLPVRSVLLPIADCITPNRRGIHATTDTEGVLLLQLRHVNALCRVPV